jgi:hypothetical protein
MGCVSGKEGAARAHQSGGVMARRWFWSRVALFVDGESPTVVDGGRW